VLVPTDFSEPANHALRYAAEEAAVHRAKVTLLHVLPRHPASVYYLVGAPDTGPGERFDAVVGSLLGAPSSSPPTFLRRDRDEDALTRLRDLIPHAFRDTWDAEIAVGDPADTIVRVAQDHGVDLVVMGTHGRTGLHHVLLGSVAEKVVRRALCPVLTVRLAWGR
jgi:nucleotide-binding universal stress UspA family protein